MTDSQHKIAHDTNVSSKAETSNINNNNNSMVGSTSADLTSATFFASLMLLLQLFVRAGTFIMNAILLRYVPASLLGMVNVRLLLLFTTVHTLSRDPYLKVFLNKSIWRLESTASPLINSLWTILLTGIIWDLVLSGIWVSPLLEQPATPHYLTTVFLYGIAALILLIEEPFLVLARLANFTKLEVAAEIIPFTLQSLLTLLMVINMPNLGVLSFAFGQLIYSIVKTFIFVLYFAYLFRNNENNYNELPVKSFKECFPLYNSSKIKFSVLQQVKSFITYTALKQILTNGEQYVMTIFSTLSFSEQGIYSIVHNIGSLAARLIFKPLEDSFMIFFTKTLPRGVLPSDLADELIISAYTVLIRLFKVVILFSLVILTFAPAYSHVLLHLYGGSLLSGGDGPILLRWYSLYVLFLAVNGMAECFCFSVMGETDIKRYNGIMIVFSIIYIIFAVFLTHLVGTVGLILSNCINMFIRIIYCFIYINNYFNRFILFQLLPSLSVILSLFVSFTVTMISFYYFSSLDLKTQIVHISIGAICFVLDLIIATQSDKWYVYVVRSKILKQKLE